MFWTRLNKNAIISIVSFAVVILKDIIVSYFEIIPERSAVNRIISWVFILPLIIISAILALRAIREEYLKKKNRGESFLNINLILSLPALFGFLYLLAKIIYALAI